MAAALKILLLCWLLNIAVGANASTESWYTVSADKQVALKVDLFLSSTCEYCHKAKAFFQKLEPNTPWLHLQTYVINEDKQALMRFNQRILGHNSSDFSVPSVFFCNSRWTGFSSEITTGKELLRALTYCKQKIEAQGRLTPATTAVLNRWANASFFGSGMVEKPTVWHYVLTMALVDAFNPCAVFVFLSFIALFAVQRDRKKQMLYGGIFIGIVGIGHYLQQVFTATYLQTIPWLRVPAALAGVLILILITRCYRKRLSHSGFLVLTLVLSVFVYWYQQTCVMDWASIFQLWLSNQRGTVTQHLLYQGVYQIMYLVPLALLLLLSLFLDRNQSKSTLRQWVTMFGLQSVLVLGVVLIVYPTMLARFNASLLMVALMLPIAWFSAHYNQADKTL